MGVATSSGSTAQYGKGSELSSAAILSRADTDVAVAVAVALGVGGAALLLTELLAAASREPLELTDTLTVLVRVALDDTVPGALREPLALTDGDGDADAMEAPLLPNAEKATVPDILDDIERLATADADADAVAIDGAAPLRDTVAVTVTVALGDHDTGVLREPLTLADGKGDVDGNADGNADADAVKRAPLVTDEATLTVTLDDGELLAAADAAAADAAALGDAEPLIDGGSAAVRVILGDTEPDALRDLLALTDGDRDRDAMAEPLTAADVATVLDMLGDTERLAAADAADDAATLGDTLPLTDKTDTTVRVALDDPKRDALREPLELIDVDAVADKD